jgi:hypothetical protein
MASWKKIIVSGSSANLAALNVDNLTSGQVVIGGGTSNLSTTAINGSGNILATTGATGVSISGSFSGSFFGNGAGLTGVTATAIFPLTQLTPIVPTTQVFVNDGSNKFATVSQFTSASFAGISGDILVDGSGVATIQPNSVAISTDVSGLGAGVASSLALNASTPGGIVTFNGALGTPSSGTLTNATGLPISTGVSGLGTGVATALAVNVGTAGSILINGGALGTPSSGTLTNATGLPISTGVSGLGTGIATFLATPSSANLAAAVTDETGTGALVFAGSPTFTGTANFGSLSTTGNATIGGDLTVAGTASFTNVDNLTVRDKFILINSGSTTLADSGWVTQYNAAGSGSAFYLEASSTGTYGRFAMAYDVIGTATALTADEYVVSAKTAAGAPAAAPTWGGSGNGFGNVYVNSSNGDIYMYS